MPDTTIAHRPPAALLAVATLACLLPFLGRAFHIDDPLFLWVAQQIERSPADFYGFQVNWYGGAEPMHEVTKNPPLAGYYLAAAGALLGYGERALHAAQLLPAVAVVVGTARLAHLLGAAGGVAALVTLASPVFLVSAAGVMCDVPMLALWIWCAVLWIGGLERRSRARLAGAALLLGAAALTKYFAMSLIPLLAVYTLARRRGEARALAWLLLPVALLALYQLYTQELYGRGLLLDAAEYARVTRHRDRSAADWGIKVLVLLCFVGGGLLPVLGYAPLLASRRLLAAGAGLALALGALCTGAMGRLAPRASEMAAGSLGAQMGLWVALGAGALALVASDLRRRRDADSLFLALWVLGTLVFAGFLNWAINGRSLLPLVPAAGILVSRRLSSRVPRPSLLRVLSPALPALAVALLVAGSDAALANANRAAAERVAAAHAGRPGRLWFQGHWGFQYYMERLGARAFDYRRSELRRADWMALPSFNAGVQRRPLRHVVQPALAIEIPSSVPVATMNVSSGAGFHYHGIGPLPFVFRTPPVFRCDVVTLTRDFTPQLREKRRAGARAGARTPAGAAAP